MNEEALQAIIESLALMSLSVIGIIFIWFAFLHDAINYTLCLFSESARYRRWDGYYGFLYIEKPLITRTGALMIQYAKENGFNLKDEYLNGTLNIPEEYLKPKEGELGKAIEFKFEWLLINYWIAEAWRYYKKRKKQKDEQNIFNS